MLAIKLVSSKPQEWFGRSLRLIHDADMWRWQACIVAARKYLKPKG